MKIVSVAIGKLQTRAKGEGTEALPLLILLHLVAFSRFGL
jgi:hypothetical protein